MEQRQQGRLESLPIARNCLAQGEAPSDFVACTIGQRDAIKLLRTGCVAHKIESEPTVFGHLRRRHARLFGFCEEPQGFDRSARAGIGFRQSQLHSRIVGRQIVGTAEEADCGFYVPQLQRRLARIEQGGHVRGVLRQAGQRITQPTFGRRRKRLDDLALSGHAL